MSIIQQAIDERLARINELHAEIEELERAQVLVGQLDEAPVKPPPPARKEAAVQPAEPRTKRARTKPGDSHFASCGHPNTPENHTSQKKCKQCVKESNHRYLRKKAGLTAPPVVASPAPLAVIAPPEPARVEAARRWQKQCSVVDADSGRRCTLLDPHPGKPHSASGREFRLPVADSALPRREVAP